MKKGTIIALIVAISLIIVGGTVLVLGLSFAGGSEPKSILTEHTVPVRESFESILIDTQDCSVEFVPYAGEADAHIVLRQREDVSHQILVADGTLKIEMHDDRDWRDHVGIFSAIENMEMKIYLPEKQYESLIVYTATGDVKVPGELSVKEATLRSDTGDIHYFGKTAASLDCMSSTGDISVRGGAPALMKLQTNTGDINLQGVAGTEIYLENNTGETEMENVTAQMLSCSSDTGDVELEKVLIEDYLQIFTTTGDVGIENSDAGAVNIETDTGDVGGNFLSPKWFQAHSDTGNVKVPSTPEGGECRIETDTGDISFFYDGSQKIG